jgi:hypothetical protein
MVKSFVGAAVSFGHRQEADHWQLAWHLRIPLGQLVAPRDPLLQVLEGDHGLDSRAGHPSRQEVITNTSILAAQNLPQGGVARVLRDIAVAGAPVRCRYDE